MPSAIKITQTERGYIAVLSPPRLFGRALAAVEEAKADGMVPPLPSEAWETTEPMTRDALTAELRRRGVHLHDIADALAQSDPNWKPSGRVHERGPKGAS